MTIQSRTRKTQVDTETELTVPEVLEQAETNGIDLYAMDAGETVTFMASAGNVRSSQQVSVTRGTMYRYADYGYGSYLTYQYTVKFGNVSATAYCVQPSKPGPGSGTMQSIRWEMEKHLLRYVIMAQKLLEMMDFSQKRMDTAI